MAKNRVVRQARTAVEDLDDSELGGDVALVGGTDENVAIVTEDEDGKPSAEEIGAEHEDDNWDQPAGKAKESQAAAEQQSQEEEGDDEDARIAYDEDRGSYDDERRPGRRSRRNRSRRDAVAQRDAEIERLTGTLGEMQKQLQQLQGGHMSMAAHSIDSQLTAARQALALADQELARAVEQGDGKSFREVQTLRDEAAQRVYALSQAQERIRAMPRPPQANGNGAAPQGMPQGPQNGQPALPPQLAAEAQRMADIFLDRNPWFDPQGTDRDSRLAKQIDQELAEEGFSPGQKAFWLEFERRTKEAGLGADYEEDEPDERPQRRREPPARRRGGGLPPTGAVRSNTGRAGRGGFVMSPVQVDLLREEGLDGPNLSKEEQAKKTRIIDAWKRGAQQARRGGQA